MPKQVLLFIAFFLCSVQICSAKKMYYSIPQITCAADLIVTGKIVKVSGNSYSFAIDQTIKGKGGKQIIVKMFDEWTCDVRLKKAETGQQLLLFLKKASLDSFDIINGGTGEVFIENNKLHGIMWPKEDSKLNDVIVGLKNFQTCYKAANKAQFPKERIKFQKIKSDTEILKYRNANQFSVWLFDYMKNYDLS